MSETELLAVVNDNLDAKSLAVVAALLVIGYFLKKTPKIPDWSIPWALTATGIFLAWGVIRGISIQSTIQGILAAGVAALTHQLWKQSTDKRSNEPGGK